MTPPASHVPLFSNEQSVTHSATPLMPNVSAPASGRRTPNGTEQGVNEEISNDNAQAIFPRSSHVIGTCTLQTTFFEDKNLVPIKIEKILGIYTLFNLLFII